MTRLQQLPGKLARQLAAAPQFLRNRTYSAFDAWPSARAVPPMWRDIPVYCISIKDATRRRAIVSMQIARMGFRSFEYVDAPDLRGSSMAALEAVGSYDDGEAVRYHGRALRPAEISCSLAHGLAYERIAAAGHARAMIIEDDALFVASRFEFVDPAGIPADFDVVFLNSFRNMRRPGDRVSDRIFGTESYTGSTCAYLVSATGAEKLARAYKPVIHAADGLLGRCMEWPEDRDHVFKRKGARTTIRSYLTIPDLVLNGSDCYYYRSIHRPAG